jgi:hypothetical protein
MLRFFFSVDNFSAIMTLRNAIHTTQEKAHGRREGTRDRSGAIAN